jgi:hypothetical protein
MKNKFLMLLIVGVSTVSIFSGCEKEDEGKVISEQLSAVEWKIVSAVRITVNGNVDDPVNPCRLDNIFRYEDNGTFRIFTGTDLCTSGELGLVGTWELVDDNTGIEIVIQGSSYTDRIVGVSSSELRLQADFGSYSIIETYNPIP